MIKQRKNLFGDLEIVKGLTDGDLGHLLGDLEIECDEMNFFFFFYESYLDFVHNFMLKTSREMKQF